jgi:hypothetical protein
MKRYGLKGLSDFNLPRSIETLETLKEAEGTDLNSLGGGEMRENVTATRDTNNQSNGLLSTYLGPQLGL